MARTAIAVVWLCWIRLSFWTVRGSTSLPQQKWRRDPAFDGRTISLASGYSLGNHTQLQARTLSLCAASCLENGSWCTSFFYIRASRLCSLHTHSFQHPVNTTQADGSRYYKYQEGDCPQWTGYTLDSYSNLCYKIHTTVVDSITSRSVCQAENASLVTLDTDRKVQTIAQVIVSNAGLTPWWFHVGASRPASEWDTAWTTNSGFFQWERTGQPMVAAEQPNSYFYPSQPDKATSQNCMDMRIDSTDYVNFTHFNAFADGSCAYQCYFICDIEV